MTYQILQALHFEKLITKFGQKKDKGHKETRCTVKNTRNKEKKVYLTSLFINMY